MSLEGELVWLRFLVQIAREHVALNRSQQMPVRVGA